MSRITLIKCATTLDTHRMCTSRVGPRAFFVQHLALLYPTGAIIM